MVVIKDRGFYGVIRRLKVRAREDTGNMLSELAGRAGSPLIVSVVPEPVFLTPFP